MANKQKRKNVKDQRGSADAERKIDLLRFEAGDLATESIRRVAIVRARHPQELVVALIAAEHGVRQVQEHDRRLSEIRITLVFQSPGGLPAPNTDHNGLQQPEVGLIVKYNGTHWVDELNVTATAHHAPIPADHPVAKAIPPDIFLEAREGSRVRLEGDDG